jgi:hypothetical protein
MKKLYTLLMFIVTVTIVAQAPQGFNYQATVRNNAGALIINKSVSFKFNIIPTSASGTAVYSESQTVTTDDLGQVSLVIGKGTATTGTFATIDWSTGTYYLGIELNTGNGFVAMGATQLLSVPYAMYAKSSGVAAIPTLASVLAKNNSANTTKITNLADPTDAQDAATKAYVDANSKSFMNINGFENSQTWQDNSTVNLVPNSFNFINANNTTLVFPSKPDNCCSRDVIYIYMMQNPDKERKVTLKPNGFPVAFSKYEDNELKSSISNTIQFVGVFKSGLNTIINVGDYWMCADFFYNETITIPTLTTNPVSLISYTSANSGGTISNDGGSPVTSRGVVWSTTKNPTIALTTKTIDSNGNGAFSSTLSSLTNGTTYYIRAYATNSVGTSYGNEITFTTNNINLSNGLIAYYPFNGNANDISGNNNGVVNNAKLTTDRFGNISSSYNFDYVDMSWNQSLHQVITIPYNPIFNSTKLSVSIWFNPRSYHYPNIFTNDKQSRLIGRFQYGYNSPNGQAWTLDLNNNQLKASIIEASNMNNQNSISVKSTISLNQWYHAVFTYDNSFLKLYINGVLVSQTPTTLNINIKGNSGISIGSSDQANGYWYESDSKIDDIGIWDRALSQDEITALFNGQKP